MVFTILLLLAFVPRFGWQIRGDNGEIYRCASVKQNGGVTELVYKSGEHKLSVSYSSRLMRDFTLKYGDEEPVLLSVAVDGAIAGGELAIADMALLSELVWKDISGIFYYRYLLSLALLALALVAFVRPDKVSLGNQNFFAMPLFLSALVALRAVL